MLMTRRSLVESANAVVSLIGLLRKQGVECDPPVEGRSVKVFCPFGFEHSDDGQEQALRLYDSNTAFCFAGHGFLTPVRLAQLMWDLSSQDAALRLLEEAGETLLLGPMDAEQTRARFAERPEMDRSALQQALNVWCARQPGWKSMEFHPDVLSVLEKLSELLPAVQSDEDAEKWLTCGKVVMERTMGRVRT